MTHKYNSFAPWLALLCLCGLLAFSAACNRGTSAAGGANPKSGGKRYTLKGKIISIDKKAGTANIGNEPIAGFMDTMVMPYSIKPAEMLDELQPGDSIIADVVVDPDRYWLENVKVTSRSQAPAAKPAARVELRERVHG